MNQNKSSLIGITGIAIGILGVVGPIAWDYYKTKSEIEFRVLENSVVIEKVQRLEGLVITYAGEEVEELSKTTIGVTNTGRTPILNKDVVQPLTLVFSAESKLIDAKVESSTPKDLGATLRLNKTSGAVNVDFPLLNPGDQFQISALAKSVKADFDVIGRIAGVGTFRLEKDLARVGTAKTIPWTIYPVGFFSLLLALVLCAGLRHMRAERRVKRALRRGSFSIPPLNSLNDCLKWIDRHFFFTTVKERRSFKEAVSTLTDQPNFTSAHEMEILRLAQISVESALSNFLPALIVAVISGLGFWYVWSNV